MKALELFRGWWQRQTGDDQSPFDADSSAFAVSFVVNLFVIVLLGLVPLSPKRECVRA